MQALYCHITIQFSMNVVLVFIIWSPYPLQDLYHKMGLVTHKVKSLDMY